MYSIKYLTIFVTILLSISCTENDAVPSKLPTDRLSLESLLRQDIPAETRLEIYDQLSYKYEEHDLVKTIDILNKELSLAEQLDNSEYQGRAYLGLGIMYEKSRDYSRAINHYMDAARFNEDCNNIKGIAHAFNNIGIVFLHIEGFQKAIPYFDKSSQFFRKIDNKKYLSKVYSNLSVCNSKLGNYQEARLYLDKSLKTQIDFDAQNIERLAYLYNENGRLYHLEEDYNSAVEMYKTALDLGEISSQLKFSLYYNLANSTMYLGADLFNNAQGWIDKADGMQIDLSVYDESYVLKTYNIQGELYQLRGNHAEALEVFNKAINYADKDAFNDDLLTTLELATKSQKALTDSNINIEYDKIFRISDLRSKQLALKEEFYENADYKSLQVLLDKEVEAYETQVKHAQMDDKYWAIIKFLIAMTLTVLVVFVISVLAAKRARRKHDNLQSKINNIKNILEDPSPILPLK